MRWGGQGRAARIAIRLACFGLSAGCGAAPDHLPRTPAQASTSAPAPAKSGEPAPPADQTGGFDGQRAYAHVEKLVGIGPRPPASDGIRRAQEYIRGQLESYGCSVETDDFSADTPVGRLPMKNFLVKIPGESRDIILLATHYDTLKMENFVGADDGGSSTGIMLEMARLHCRRKNRLSIWIAFFDGEEALQEWSETDSRYGSRQMAARMAASGELKHIKAMLLADIVGSRPLRIQRDSTSTRWLTDLVWSAANRLGYGAVFVSEETAVEDDHDSFLRRKVPAVDIIGPISAKSPYWHTPRDTLDKVSARSLAIAGHVLVKAVAELERKFP